MATPIFEIALSFLHEEPDAAARLLELQPAEKVALFLANAPLDDAEAAMHRISSEFAADLFQHGPAEFCAAMANRLQIHHLAHILRLLTGKQQERILAQLTDKRRRQCTGLLHYASHHVGAWIDSHVPTLPGNLTVEECLQRIKKRAYNSASDVYLIDERRRLTTTLKLEHILNAPEALPLQSLDGTHLPQLSGMTPLSEAVHHFGWQQTDALPVHNQHHAFIGVLSHHRLRQGLSRAPADPSSNSNVVQAGEELYLAYRESLRSVLGLFFRDTRDNPRNVTND